MIFFGENRDEDGGVPGGQPGIPARGVFFAQVEKLQADIHDSSFKIQPEANTDRPRGRGHFLSIMFLFSVAVRANIRPLWRRGKRR